MYPDTIPHRPFYQLLNVLPPKSSYLLPSPLAELLSNEKSQIAKYCHCEMKIDLAGKKAVWEGITILPFMDQKLLEQVYKEAVKKVDKKFLHNNQIGKNLIYKFDIDNISTVKSYYGDIKDCAVSTSEFNLSFVSY